MNLRLPCLLALALALPLAAEDATPEPAASPTAARPTPLAAIPEDHEERIIILVGGVHSYLLAGDEDLPPGAKDGSVLPVLLKTGWRVADLFSPAPTSPILVRIIRKRPSPPPANRVPGPLPTPPGHD